METQYPKSRSDETVPDGNGTFSGEFRLGHPTINDAGDVAFFSFIGGSSGGEDENEGVFLGNGVETVQIAHEGQSAPDGNESSRPLKTLEDQQLTNRALSHFMQISGIPRGVTRTMRPF